MADKARNVVLNFKMDGQVQYAQTLKQINMVMNTAAKEYKNHIAAMGKDASMTDKLAAEKKKLEIQMEGAAKRTAMLRAEFDAMSKDTNTTSDELNKMYGKLLDAERAETALSNSLERVSDGLSEQAQEAREAHVEINRLKGETKLLEAEQKSLTSSFKLQNAELGENADESEQLELAQKQLQQQMKLTDQVIDNLEQQLTQSKRAYGENSVEVKQLEAKLNEARATVKKFENSLESMGKSGKESANDMEQLNKKMDLNNALEAGEALQGVSDQLIAMGKAAMDSSLKFGDSQTNLQANLAITADEAKKLNSIVDEVFKYGVVESMEEASAAVVSVKRNFKDLDDTQLNKLTNQVTAIAKRTGTDVSENVRAAERLMFQFGLTGEQSMDLIAKGYQNGLNKSDDFLDTLNEYTPLFAEADFTAEEMFATLNAGMENGAFNTDKVADAVKELQLKFGDGSFEKNIDAFSQQTKQLFKGWQDGKVSMTEVMDSIKKDIQKMDTHKQIEALGHLGTQYEDLGVRATVSILDINKELKDVTGTAEKMAEKSPTEKWESSLRELSSNMKGIGSTITESLTPVVEGLSELAKLFDKLPEPIKLFTAVLGGLAVIGVILIPIIAALAVSFGLLNIAIAPIIAVIVALAAYITGIILVIKNWGAITDWLSEKWSEFSTWFGELWESIVQTCEDAWSSTVTYFEQAWSDFLAMMHEYFGPIGQFFSDLWSDIVTTATEWWSQLTLAWEETWSTIMTILEPAISFLTTILEGAWLLITAGVQIAWLVFKEYIINPVGDAFNWVSGKIGELVGWLSGKWEDIKSATSSAWNSVKENIINPIGDAYNSVVGKLSDMYNSAVEKFNSIKNAASEKFEAAKNAIVDPIKSAVEKVGEWIDKIKGFFSNLVLKIPKPEMPKMPSFHLETSTKEVFGKEITYPSGIGVKWNAKGGIFTRPTIFGAHNGVLQGAGEAGPEGVLPLNEKTLGDIGKGIAATMGGTGEVVVHVYLDSDQLNSKLAPGMSEKINRQNTINARAQGVIA